MSFGKRTQTETQEPFALILNPIRGELQKSRMIERMVRVFPLAIEEANDLVENTPIILLEGLDEATGSQLRDYFHETGADVMLTDDGKFKRRCFRAVWPSPPSIDSFAKLSSSAPNAGSGANALSETKPEEDIALAPSPWEQPETSSSSFDSAGGEAVNPSSEAAEEKTFSSPRDAFLKEFQSNELSQAEPAPFSFDASAASLIQEEKISALNLEKERLQSVILDLQRENDELRAAQSRSLELEKELEALRQKTSLFDAEHARLCETIKAKEEAIRATEERLKQVEETQSSYLESKGQAEAAVQAKFLETERMLQEERRRLTSEIDELRRISEERENDLRRMDGQLQEEKSRFLSELDELQRASETREAEIGRLGGQLQSALEQNRSKTEEMNRLQSETTSLKVETEGLKRILAESQQDSLEQKKAFESLRLDLEEKLREKNIEIDAWRKRSEEWSASRATLIRELELLRQKHSSEMESLQAKNQEIQSQLEPLKRQVREFAGIAEQQDLVNKRNRIAVQLADKEAKLRELTHRRGMIEQRAKEQQDALEATAAERAALERDIHNDKQSEKHILEQLKIRDRNRVSILERIQRAKERTGSE